MLTPSSRQLSMVTIKGQTAARTGTLTYTSLERSAGWK